MLDSKFQGAETHMGSRYIKTQTRIRFRAPKSPKRSTDVCAKISNSLGHTFQYAKNLIKPDNQIWSRSLRAES